MEKIEVSFDRVSYEVNLSSLQKNIEKIVGCLDAIEKIKGERQLCTIEDIDKYITDKTTFANVLLSATLLEVGNEYKYLEHNLNKINLEVVEFIDNVPTTKKDVLESIKIANTQYLKEQYLKDYELLKKASEILNKISNPTLVNCLKSDYAGRYSINLPQLNNSDRI